MFVCRVIAFFVNFPEGMFAYPVYEWEQSVTFLFTFLYILTHFWANIVLETDRKSDGFVKIIAKLAQFFPNLPSIVIDNTDKRK